MKPGNYAAIALLLVTMFFERLGYYGFRGTVVLRLLQEQAVPAASVSTLMMVGSALLILGGLLGAGLSVVTRHRFALLGSVLAFTAAHGLGAFSPRLGLLGVSLLAGLVRPLLYVSLAEELDREARVWKAVVVASLVAFVTNLGAALGGFTGPLEHSRMGSHALPVVALLLALVCVAVVAFALPGQPFRWESGDSVRVAPGLGGLYRPEPTVHRDLRGPDPLVLLLVGFAAVLSACEQSVHSHALFSVLGSSGGGSWLSGLTASLISPLIACSVSVLLGALGALLASQRSPWSPTWILGGGLLSLALGALVMAAGVAGTSPGIAMLSALLDGLGGGLFLPVATAYVLATLSSRWAGLASVGYSMVLYVPGLFLNLIIRHLTSALPVVLVAFGLLTVAGAVAAFVLGPRLHSPRDIAKN